jgi:hypothetical protein
MMINEGLYVLWKIINNVGVFHGELAENLSQRRHIPFYTMAIM